MPTRDGLNRVRQFRGILGVVNHDVSISFEAHIDDSGDIVLALEQIPLIAATAFILQTWHDSGNRIAYFRLSGVSDDNVHFKTDHLYFNSIGPHSDIERGSYFVFAPQCASATFHRIASELRRCPILLIHIRGFQCFGSLHTSSDIGEVVMNGEVRSDDLNKVSGILGVSAQSTPSDEDEWRDRAAKLLDHVRRVMSFAAGINLTDPVREYRSGNRIEISAKSLPVQRRAHSPTCHEMDRQAIFDTAVKSYSSPKHSIENLWMALEWFSMDATYNEVRLINAMTALENIISSNTRDVADLLDPDPFKRLRRSLLDTIKHFVEQEVQSPTRAELVDELSSKLGELRRRPLKRRLQVLLQRWSVPMNGITTRMIGKAFDARNRIVHEGRYYVEGKQLPDLWEHVCVVREIVTRIVFSSIGYEGRYISRLGGYCHTVFPPVDEPTRD